MLTRLTTNRHTTRVLGLAVVAVLFAAVGCSGSGEDGAGDPVESGQSDTQFVSGSGTVTSIKPDQREQAPELTGPTLDGDRLDLASYRGKTVVVNVWGSWCAPCRKEAPDLVAAATELKPRGVRFVGINSRDNDRAPAKAFVRRFDVTYPSLYDPTGQQLLGFRETLPPNAIPSTLVIDPKGRVAARVVGVVSKDTLKGLVSDVLVEP